jgi:hypothetical protein
MTSEPSQRLGRVDDAEEEQEPSSTTDGPAAEGEYDPSQGSPGQEHPTGQNFPDEAARFDDPDERPRSTEPGAEDAG